MLKSRSHSEPETSRSNCQKSGDIITLKYENVEFLNQPHATNVENVNPFNVVAFVGVILDPPSDN